LKDYKPIGLSTPRDALAESTAPSSKHGRREAERLLRKPTNDASAPPPAALATDELVARVSSTAACARDLGIALGCDAAPVLPIVARALTGAGDAIAWPETLDPWEQDDDELSIFDGELHPAARRASGENTGQRRAKRKARRSARKQSRRR